MINTSQLLITLLCSFSIKSRHRLPGCSPQDQRNRPFDDPEPGPSAVQGFRRLVQPAVGNTRRLRRATRERLAVHQATRHRLLGRRRTAHACARPVTRERRLTLGWFPSQKRPGTEKTRGKTPSCDRCRHKGRSRNLVYQRIQVSTRLPFIVFSSSYLLHIPNPRAFTGISYNPFGHLITNTKSDGAPFFILHTIVMIQEKISYC